MTDFADKMLTTCFEMLRDYIEIEKARSFCVLHPEHNKDRPRWWNQWWWRRPDLGLKRLQEEAGYRLEDGSVSITAQTATELHELYNWWVYDRPKRPNPFDSLYVGIDKAVVVPEFAEEAEHKHEAQIEEDQQMLARLLKIRPYMI